MNHLANILKSDGTTQLFEEEKLVNSLRRVGAPAEAIEEIVDTVEREMRDGMTTNAIYGRAFELLKKHAHHIAVKYSIRHGLMELGPDGFPFERFVARIFQFWGYDTLTDQTVPGSCIPHEVDVVAWKEDKLVMVEAKFHNELGMKSDAKVALYIQARREDLQEVYFDYGGIKRVFDEFWLVTNTKFTDQAVHYGVCKGLKMIGWNYPADGNLHDIIERGGLHPVTCFTTLSHQQKKDLIGRNILICADVIKKPDVLKDIGVKDPIEIQRVVEEARRIIEMAK